MGGYWVVYQCTTCRRIGIALTKSPYVRGETIRRPAHMGCPGDTHEVWRCHPEKMSRHETIPVKYCRCIVCRHYRRRPEHKLILTVPEGTECR